MMAAADSEEEDLVRSNGVSAWLGRASRSQDTAVTQSAFQNPSLTQESPKRAAPGAGSGPKCFQALGSPPGLLQSPML